MGTYKGNKGHLMQHWTLCELLRVAQERGVTQLSFIDAHAMAPLATTRTSPGVVFDRVRDGLSTGRSLYEKAWNTLAPTSADGYPNSANFVQHLWGKWGGKFSLFLCEIAPAICDEIKAWCRRIAQDRACSYVTYRCKNWRVAFEDGVPLPSYLGLVENPLSLVSFDPYVISKSLRRYPSFSPNVYPNDLQTIGKALDEIKGGVILQLSTYDNNGPNPQGEVKEVLDNRLGAFGFQWMTKSSPNLKMMSLIYTRNVAWAHELEPLGERFSAWLKRFQ